MKSTEKKTSTRKRASKKTATALPIRYKARGRYRIVDGPSQLMIDPSSQEVRTED